VSIRTAREPATQVTVLSSLSRTILAALKLCSESPPHLQETWMPPPGSYRPTRPPLFAPGRAPAVSWKTKPPRASPRPMLMVSL